MLHGAMMHVRIDCLLLLSAANGPWRSISMLMLMLTAHGGLSHTAGDVGQRDRRAVRRVSFKVKRSDTEEKCSAFAIRDGRHGIGHFGFHDPANFP